MKTLISEKIVLLIWYCHLSF